MSKSSNDILEGVKGMLFTYAQCLDELPDITDSYRKSYGNRIGRKITAVTEVQATIESQNQELIALRAREKEFATWKKKQQDALYRIFKKVEEQANDEGLWCQPVYASEAYIQSALRQLHEVIEGKTSAECALSTLLSTQHEEKCNHVWVEATNEIIGDVDICETCKEVKTVSQKEVAESE